MNQFPAPDTWQEFERICLEFLRDFWGRPDLELYAARGQTQHGVDIVDQVNVADLWAAQCKFVAISSALKPEDIRVEVTKTLTYPQPIKSYTICTTTKKDKALEDEVMAINKEHNEKGLFPVKLMYWEEIVAELVQRPKLAERLLGSSFASTRTVVREELAPIVEAVADAAKKGESGVIERDLLLAVKHMEKAEFPVALALLKNLKNTMFDRMTSLQRFRCLTNIGMIETRDGNTAAASLFLDAYKEHPQHEKAVANKALAEHSLGDPAKAWQTLQDGIKAEPNNPNVAAAYVVYAPASERPEALLESVTPTLREHIQVVGAFAHLFLDQGRYDEAVVWAKKLAKDEESEAAALFIEARAVQLSIQPEDPRDVLNAEESRKKMEHAASLYEKSALAYEKNGFRLMAIQSRLNQLDAARLVGDITMFARVIEAGLQLAREQKHQVSESRFLLARSQMNTQKKDFEAAFPDAEAAHKLSDALDAHMVYAYALSNRNRPGDRAKAQEELLSIMDKLSGATLEEAADLVIAAFVSAKAFDKAESALGTAVGVGMESARADVYRAEIAQAKGEHEAAKQFAISSKDKLTAASSYSTRRLLGKVLCAVGLNEDAALVIQPLASSDHLSSDTRVFLDYLRNAGKDADFLKWAADLSAAGIKDDGLLNIQIELLYKYDPEKALIVLEEGLSWASSAPWLRVWRFHLGVRLHRLQNLRLEDVPSADTVELQQVYPTVEALKESGLHLEAVEYAYRCLHRFPKDSAAHAAFISSILLVNDDKLRLSNPVEVVPGSVVEYAEEGSTGSSYIVIDDDVPSSFANMAMSSDAIAKPFLSHKTGDKITLASGAQDRTAVIRAIYNRYTYRLGQSQSSWQLQFPDKPFLQQIRVETDAAGQFDIGPMMKMLGARQAEAVRLDGLYKTGDMSVGLLAHAMGRHIFDVMGHLTHEHGMFLNCALVTDKSHEEGMMKLNGAKGLVLDSTALWALSTLDLVELIGKMPVPVLIPSEVLDALQEKIKSLDPEKGAKMMTKIGDKIGLIERTPEEVAVERKKWESIAEIVRKHCKVGSALASAALQAETRDSLHKFTGDHGLESIAAAKDAGFLLWTDDRLLDMVAKEYFQVDRVWTQLVLEWLMAKGVITKDIYELASAKFQALNYLGNGVRAETLIAAGRSASWDVSSSLIQKNLDILSDPATTSVNALVMALCFLAASAKEASAEQQVSLTSYMLEILARREDGISLIQGIQNRLSTVAAHYPEGAARIQKVVEVWLKDKLII